MSYSFIAALVAIGLVPTALAGGYVIGQETAKPDPAPEVGWIYGPRQTFSTGQDGVIVYCQGKTNSRAFAARKHATPGDVVVQTCRAVRAPEAS